MLDRRLAVWFETDGDVEMEDGRWEMEDGRKG
jgi:hypothetical protein